MMAVNINSSKVDPSSSNKKERVFELKKPSYKKELMMLFRNGDENCCNGNNRCCHQ